MTNALQVFNYQGNQVRTIEKEGETWFVAKDVLNALGYSPDTQPSGQMRALPEIWKGVQRIHTPGGKQDMLCISEQGLYFFLGRSDKPKALPFQIWLAGEVLPAIRKHGAYISDAVIDEAKKDPEFINALISRIAEEREKNRELREEIVKNRACTVLGQIVLAADGCFTVQNAAQFLAQKGFNTGQNRLYKRLRDKHWLCGRDGKQKNKPTQYAIEHGFLNLQIGEKNNVSVMVTPKALSKLADEFTKEERPLIYIIDKEDLKALTA